MAIFKDSVNIGTVLNFVDICKESNIWNMSKSASLKISFCCDEPSLLSNDDSADASKFCELALAGGGVIIDIRVVCVVGKLAAIFADGIVLVTAVVLFATLAVVGAVIGTVDVGTVETAVGLAVEDVLTVPVVIGVVIGAVIGVVVFTTTNGI
jgi:hypothetical protein